MKKEITKLIQRKTYVMFLNNSSSEFNVYFTQKAMHNSILYVIYVYVFKASITTLDFRGCLIELLLILVDIVKHIESIIDSVAAERAKHMVLT